MNSDLLFANNLNAVLLKKYVETGYPSPENEPLSAETLAKLPIGTPCYVISQAGGVSFNTFMGVLNNNSRKKQPCPVVSFITEYMPKQFNLDNLGKTYNVFKAVPTISHFIVINEWATPNEVPQVSVISLTHSYEEALNRFNNYLFSEKENDRDLGYDSFEEHEGYYCAFKDGEYYENHNLIYIEEVKSNV